MALAITDANLYAARDLWFSDLTSALTIYGHISAWDTSAVTSMEFLFCGNPARSALCNANATTFNVDLSLWNTSGVTNMHGGCIGCRQLGRRRRFGPNPGIVMRSLHALHTVKWLTHLCRVQGCSQGPPHSISQSHSTRAASQPCEVRVT